jgi:hypothetical protein
VVASQEKLGPLGSLDQSLLHDCNRVPTPVTAATSHTITLSVFVLQILSPLNELMGMDWRTFRRCEEITSTFFRSVGGLPLDHTASH